MGVIVNFDYNSWIARYPEFGPNGAQPVSSTLAGLYFNEATLYSANNGSGPVRDATTQSMLLNMMTAHIAALNAPLANGQPASSLVGRISNATEGSVTLGIENQYPPGSPQWFQQTKYGAAWWAATAQYRTMRYTVGPTVVPAFRGFSRGFFGGG
jgi:hypothetical protein